MGAFGCPSNEPFPWHLGVYDAHCHPTDTVQSLDDVQGMKARMLTIMATRAQDQILVSQAAKQNGVGLELVASQSSQHDAKCRILPAFGWHPWFSHHMRVDTEGISQCSKIEHYRKVLTPSPQDDTFIQGLPDPSPFSEFLSETRLFLEKHPYALVGEIGIDKSFRVPENSKDGRSIDEEAHLTPGSREGRRLSPYRVNVYHQKRILQAQLHLAGEMGRAVSVHGVAAHGILFDALQETWKDHKIARVGRSAKKSRNNVEIAQLDIDLPHSNTDSPAKKLYPPRICLHSYSGPPETILRYLNCGSPATIFFSFSEVINFSTTSTRAVESVKAVPHDRLLLESDLHMAGGRMDDLLEGIARRLCEIRGWNLEVGVKQFAANWKHFALGVAP